MTPKQIVKKEPFKRILPYAQQLGIVDQGEKTEVTLPNNSWEVIDQEKFMAEYYPSGHAINLRPNKRVTDKDGNLIKNQPVAKIAVPLQKVIATKQKIHLATNDLDFVLTEQDRTEDKENKFVEFKQAWKDKNMHVALSKSIGSWLETAETALYFYRSNGVLKWKDFGFKNGDILLPHFDSLGNLEVFGRMYSGLDKGGKTMTLLDVIDKSTISTYSQRGRLGSFFTMSDWKQIKKPVVHGFSEIPICYKRSNDVCWGEVQPLIDSYEEAISNMAENNRYYANAILFIRGSVSTVPGRDDAGKMLQATGQDSDAKFLATPESNEAQTSELKILLEQIFMGSFTVSVSPDTVKSSGDLPGITVKLLFSPATEKALDSAKELDEFVDKAVSLFKEGLSKEKGKTIGGVADLKVRGSISIYVPKNDEEIVRMLNDSVFAKTISRETGAEKNPMAVNGEFSRVKSEVAEENAGSLEIE